MADDLRPEDVPPGFAPVRLVNGMWHDGHFEQHLAGRPLADGPALMLVFEGGIPEGIDWRRIGAALGSEIGRVMQLNETIAAIAKEAPGGRVN